MRPPGSCEVPGAKVSSQNVRSRFQPPSVSPPGSGEIQREAANRLENPRSEVAGTLFFRACHGAGGGRIVGEPAAVTAPYRVGDMRATAVAPARGIQFAD